MIVSQGYDGVSVMSGHCSGVQARIKEAAPMAMYVHCYAHLILVDSTRNHKAFEVFALMETIYVFISTAKVHNIFVEYQSVLYPNKPVCQLQCLSDTWWVCRFFSIDAVQSCHIWCNFSNFVGNCRWR